MLTGLADDDHLQYLTEGRGDARYTPIDPVTLGVNSTADTTNRLAVSSPASLFNHDGNGHQVKINKNSGSDTASFLFQDGFSGRAEIGLTGDDDFHLKVSPDGSAWFDSIRIDRTTGKVSFPAAGGGPRSSDGKPHLLRPYRRKRQQRRADEHVGRRISDDPKGSRYRRHARYFGLQCHDPTRGRHVRDNVVDIR